MRIHVWQFVRSGAAGLLVALLAVNSNLFAQTHVVSPADLQKAAVAATQTRQQNVKTVTQFLSSPQADKAFRSAHLDPKQVKTAVASLSDEEVARLASRVDKTQADFAAGDLTNRDLLYILLAIAALILIIVAVRH